MRMYHVRLDKEMRIADALTFMAADRSAADEAFAGDIIGLHNHGTINIGDTFTEGEKLTFTGIPNFAPEMFRRAVLKDPLKMKALAKGLDQLCEEGATQLFKPLRNNDLILGAVGQLQFEVVAFRLQDEYGVTAVFETIGVHTARWVYCDDEKHLEEFRTKAYDHLAHRSLRRAGVSRAFAGEPGADDGALAEDRVPRDARAPRNLRRRLTRRLAPVRDLIKNRPVFAWALYDWANSAFATTVMAGFFPVFFQKFWSTGVDGDGNHLASRLWQRDRRLRHRHSRAHPRRHRRPRRHAQEIHVCVDAAGCRRHRRAVLHGERSSGSLRSRCSCSRPSASTAASCSTMRCCSMLRPGELDRVSAFGYSLGYLGGGLLFLVNMLMVQSPASFGLRDSAQPCRCRS